MKVKLVILKVGKELIYVELKIYIHMKLQLFHVIH